MDICSLRADITGLLLYSYFSSSSFSMLTCTNCLGLLSCSCLYVWEPWQTICPEHLPSTVCDSEVVCLYLWAFIVAMVVLLTISSGLAFLMVCDQSILWMVFRTNMCRISGIQIRLLAYLHIFVQLMWVSLTQRTVVDFVGLKYATVTSLLIRTLILLFWGSHKDRLCALIVMV